MSEEEARRLVEGNPLSFLRVSRPETGLPRGTDPHSGPAYAQGRAAFDTLLADGALRRDEAPAYYLYRQVMGAHHQTGVVAAASCREYLDGTIRKHELTRPDKEDDRVRHIEALAAQTGPAFLFHRAAPALAAFIRQRTEGRPDVDFVAPDGVRHTTWTVGDREGLTFLATQFAAIPRLYIADGHHRSAAAARVFEQRRGAGGSGGLLSVIFAHDALQVLPYHRVLKDLNGWSADGLLGQLAEVFDVGQPAPLPGAALAPRTVGLCLEGRWRLLRYRPELLEVGEPADRLDVALLQRHVLAPVFGVDNPRTSERIGFVGGIRGPAELERMVVSGACACAFAMAPTSLGELMDIADRGGIMPPKSTWFEPKLRDALFCLPI
jgi:uncharacterized protein (DUF1015 family)